MASTLIINLEQDARESLQKSCVASFNVLIARYQQKLVKQLSNSGKEVRFLREENSKLEDQLDKADTSLTEERRRRKLAESEIAELKAKLRQVEQEQELKLEEETKKTTNKNNLEEEAGVHTTIVEVSPALQRQPDEKNDMNSTNNNISVSREVDLTISAASSPGIAAVYEERDEENEEYNVPEQKIQTVFEDQFRFASPPANDDQDEEEEQQQQLQKQNSNHNVNEKDDRRPLRQTKIVLRKRTNSKKQQQSPESQQQQQQQQSKSLSSSTSSAAMHFNIPKIQNIPSVLSNSSSFNRIESLLPKEQHKQQKLLEQRELQEKLAEEERQNASMLYQHGNRYGSKEQVFSERDEENDGLGDDDHHHHDQDQFKQQKQQQFDSPMNGIEAPKVATPRLGSSLSSRKNNFNNGISQPNSGKRQEQQQQHQRSFSSSREIVFTEEVEKPNLENHHRQIQTPNSNSAAVSTRSNNNNCTISKNPVRQGITTPVVVTSDFQDEHDSKQEQKHDSSKNNVENDNNSNHQFGRTPSGRIRTVVVSSPSSDEKKFVIEPVGSARTLQQPPYQQKHDNINQQEHNANTVDGNSSGRSSSSNTKPVAEMKNVAAAGPQNAETENNNSERETMQQRLQALLSSKKSNTASNATSPSHSARSNSNGVKKSDEKSKKDQNADDDHHHHQDDDEHDRVSVSNSSSHHHNQNHQDSDSTSPSTNNHNNQRKGSILQNNNNSAGSTRQRSGTLMPPISIGAPGTSASSPLKDDLAAIAELFLPEDTCKVKLDKPKGKIPKKFMDGNSLLCSVEISDLTATTTSTGGGAAVAAATTNGGVLNSASSSSSLTLNVFPAVPIDAPAAVARAAAREGLSVGIKYITKFQAIVAPAGFPKNSFVASVSFLTATTAGTLNLCWMTKEYRNEFLMKLKDVRGAPA